jgi:hypothetical protein
VSITIGLPPLNQLVIGITNIECALCLSNAGVHIYSVLATTNLTFWTVIGDMQGSNGNSSYLDPAFTNLPHRFYRAGPQTDLGFFSWQFNTNFMVGVPQSGCPHAHQWLVFGEQHKNRLLLRRLLHRHRPDFYQRHLAGGGAGAQRLSGQQHPGHQLAHHLDHAGQLLSRHRHR